MKQKTYFGSFRAYSFLKLVSSLGMFALLTACASNPDFGGVEYRADRAAEAMAVQRFSECETEALRFDASAREQASIALYQTAARTMDACLAEVDPYRDAVPVEQRMQLHALSVMDYFKAGDLENATAQLQAFELVYGMRDLYFADQSSFLDSFRLLLGDAPASAAQQHSQLNARAEVKSEIRRHQHWQTH